jgi:hypothetical protein
MGEGNAVTPGESEGLAKDREVLVAREDVSSCMAIDMNGGAPGGKGEALAERETVFLRRPSFAGDHCHEGDAVTRVEGCGLFRRFPERRNVYIRRVESGSGDHDEKSVQRERVHVPL